VFAILLLAEYPRDMHCRILSGFIPPPLSAIDKVEINKITLFNQVRQG